MAATQPAKFGQRLQALEYRLGTHLASLCDSPVGFLGTVLFAAVLAAVTEFLVHELLTSLSAPEVVHAALDAALMGFATAVVVSFLLMAIRERHRRMLKEMERVAELNHSVRNALQVIVHSQYLSKGEQNAATVLESVQRIDITLRELFPAMPRQSQPQAKTKTDAA
jgi:hypothetical protein